MKKKSANPSGKYVWLRAQIGKILRNEVYLGSVVGRKFQKVSHKIAKVRCTKKEEHIILENMHEPIIDIETWKMAQDKLNGYTKTRERKYDHILKGLVYCGECGNKATLRCREEKRKNGNVWRATYFICSKRNNYSGLCDNKQISADLIEEVVLGKIKEEIKQINLSEKEIKEIYQKAEKEAKSTNNLLQTKLQELQLNIKKVESNIEEIYQDKINKLIRVEDFKMIYEKKQKERNKILKEIKKTEEDFKKINNMKPKVHLKEIKQITEEFLNMKKPNKMILEKLIERIEFDKNKNISVKLTFKNTI